MAVCVAVFACIACDKNSMQHSATRTASYTHASMLYIKFVVAINAKSF